MFDMKLTVVFPTLLSIILFSALTIVHAQNRIELIPEESQLWIEGSSTVNDILCKAGKLIAYANIRSTELDNPSELIEENNGNVKLNVPVYEFDCGRRQMNRDFFRALRAEHYPTIDFEYQSARLITNLDPQCAPFQLDVEGILTVAGVGRQVNILVDIEPCEENKLRLKGSKVINMLDYGIEPPTALFGLIRANEKLEVFFSLTAKQKP